MKLPLTRYGVSDLKQKVTILNLNLNRYRTIDFDFDTNFDLLCYLYSRILQQATGNSVGLND